MSYLLVWFVDGEPRAAELSDLPKALVHGGETFDFVPDYFGDVDYLRDERNRLIGFGYALPVKNEELKLYQVLIAQITNAKRQDGMLVILLKPSAFEIECVQAMGSQLYRSSTGRMILAVPNSGFGELAFELTPTDVPWPERF